MRKTRVIYGLSRREMEFFVGEAEIEIKCSVGGKDQGS